MQRVIACSPGTPAYRALIDQGLPPDGDGRQRVRPRAVRADGQVEFEVFDAPASARFGDWVAATRPPSLTATATPAIAVWLHGLAAGWDMAWPVALAALFGVMALQVAVNLLNDVEDHRRLIDLPGTLGGAGSIQRGVVSAAAVRRVATGAAIVGLALGVPAFLRDPAAFAIIAALAVVGGLGYSSGPGLKYRALGDLSVIALCGPALTIGTSLAAFGRFDAFVVGVGLALGLAAVGLLHVNNFQDMRIDRQREVTTLALRLGQRGSRVYLVAIYALAFAAWPVSVAIAGWPWWVAFVPAPAVVPVVRLVRALVTTPTPETLTDARMRAAQAHLLYGLAICLGLGLAGLI
jgi:1,4-dihydroxy-2-naphthoate octaprenyltransferase